MTNENLGLWRVVKSFDCRNDFRVPFESILSIVPQFIGQLNQYELKKEFEDYQRTRKIEIIGPIRFWKNQRIKYPNLSKVVCMYLSIPMTSCDIERFFSKFHYFLGENQFNMNEASIEKRMFIMFN